jgi:hypothetical protein
MAAKGSMPGWGWGLITVLAITSLGSLVSFAIFFSKFNDANRRLVTAQQEQNDVVRPDERNRDDVRNLVEEAKKNRQSLVGYLVEGQQAVMQRATGNRRETIATLDEKLKAIPGADSQPMLAVIASRDSELGNLRNQLQQADAARQQALADLRNEVERVSAVERRHQETLATINSQLGQVKGEVDTYRTGTDGYKKELDQRLDEARQAAAEAEARLKKQLDELTAQKLIVDNQLAVLRGQRNQAVLRTGDESALVDAEIVGTNSGDGTAFLSIGRRENVVLGMTFTVYPSAASIRPNDNGEYPPGKATLEIINVGETTSTARITSEVRGNPVVKGDVVANAVFDPSKKYKFVIFGNFDADRDGLATTIERQNIEAMIRAWGGELTEDMTGDVDFLVLGQRPLIPPRPASDAPFEVVQEYFRREREVERYDSLNRQAQSTSVPVLNENRLYTLIGKRPAERR